VRAVVSNQVVILLTKPSVQASRFDVSMPFWVTALAIAAWSAAAAWINPAQYADNLEQFSWSHSIELGYWKHPPLPTWLIAIPIRLIGFSVYWTYALAAMCFIGTVFFTWRITQRMFGQQAATFTVLLSGLHIGFSWRAQLYNHNTVLLLFSAATVWATMRAIEADKKSSNARWSSWVLAGALAGLAMLSKYQALVPLIGIFVALYVAGYFKQASVRRGVAIAALTALLVFLPHLIWIVTGSGSTVDNALQTAEGLNALGRFKGFFRFLMVQIRFHFPILMAIALLVLFKPRGTVESAADMTLTQQNRAWLLGLIVWPAVFVSLVALTGGVRLQAQWGLQTFQFLTVFIGWRLAIVLPQRTVWHTIRVVLLAQLVLAGFFAWSVIEPSQKIWQSARTRNFPAVSIAKEISSKWYQATNCELKYVVGPSFEATIVSSYSGYNPIVLEDGDFGKEPWVTKELLKTSGALYLAATASALPAELASSGQVDVPARENDFQPARQIFWGVALPQARCN
jgi:4-amino-4-deoxy-L-arabinose transferase-like glycosyltransferase